MIEVTLTPIEPFEETKVENFDQEQNTQIELLQNNAPKTHIESQRKAPAQQAPVISMKRIKLLATPVTSSKISGAVLPGSTSTIQFNNKNPYGE